MNTTIIALLLCCVILLSFVAWQQVELVTLNTQQVLVTYELCTLNRRLQGAINTLIMTSTPGDSVNIGVFHPSHGFDPTIADTIRRIAK